MTLCQPTHSSSHRSRSISLRSILPELHQLIQGIGAEILLKQLLFLLFHANAFLEDMPLLSFLTSRENSTSSFSIIAFLALPKVPRLCKYPITTSSVSTYRLNYKTGVASQSESSPSCSSYICVDCRLPAHDRSVIHFGVERN